GPMPDVVAGEDCLIANIWTPAPDGGKRPVMVWLHGRGFAEGAGSEGWYDGTNLALNGDVVVVTLNHRLNVFGYLHLTEVGGEAFAGSGVAGILDLAEALRWVRDNIEAFGGDPGNVTIFGESGGGRKVCSLLAMPSAEGLFHRAIVQSSVMLRATDPERATAFARALIAEAGLAEGDVAGLQALPFEQLTEAYQRTQKAQQGFQCAPTIDAAYFPHHPHDPEGEPAPSSLRVPLMIGTNKDEMALFMARHPKRRKLTEPELHEELQKTYGDRWQEILDTYRRSRPDDTPWDLLVGIESEPRRLAANQVVEMRHRAGAAPTYLYLFDWESDFLGGLFKAAHAMEIPFVFDNAGIVPMTGERTDRGALGKLMSTTWAAFARDADPKHDGLPRWEPFDPGRRATMVFDVPAHAEDDPRSEERRVWEGDLSHYR
ncbi:MAG: carboxylesterase family protein, partial [Dehalococcoidia bacterium]|nr:carboxylesterase family protein [Dehalococcoidia bacterium]